MIFAAAKRFLSSNQNRIHAWTYPVGRYSDCGVNHWTSGAASSGVPPAPQNPIITPASHNIATARWVIDVPVPNSTTVVLAMGMFQYALTDRSASAFRYTTRPALTDTRQCSRYSTLPRLECRISRGFRLFK